MTVKALREFIGDDVFRRRGDVFAIDDLYARRLIARRLVEPHVVMEIPRAPVREVQAFLGAPEIKAQPIYPAAEPLITCVIPTADRHDFILEAVRSFQRQTYERKQLLIIDDGVESARRLIPTDHPHIRYVQLDEKVCLGRKRNIAVQYAAGDFVAHFDDDDLSAPDRIARQLKTLRETGASVTGYRDLVFIDERQRVYRMTGEPGYAAGTSLMYRRDWALRHPFPEVQHGEDNGFLSRAGNALVATPSEDRIVARIHQGNTVRKRPGGRGWRRLRKEDLPAWANI